MSELNTNSGSIMINAILQTLSSTEEKDLINYRGSNLNAPKNGTFYSDREKELILAANWSLVKTLALKYYTVSDDLEDKEQNAVIGLLKAINTYDWTRNIRFSTYAYKVISYHLNTCYKKLPNTPFTVSLEDEVNNSNDEDLSFIKVLCDKNIDVENSALKEWYISCLNLALESLKEKFPKEYGYIRMNHGLGGIERKTQKEIAAMMNISQVAVHHTLKKGYDYLRTILKARYGITKEDCIF